MSVLSPEVKALLKDPDVFKVLATVDDKGHPHVVFKNHKIDLLDDGTIVYAEVIESSHTNSNLIHSLWFDKHVAITVKGRDGTSYQIKGKVERYDFVSNLFRESYRKLRARKGPDSELSGLWYIRPESVKDETPSVRRAEEDTKHPFFRHLDRELVAA